MFEEAAAAALAHNCLELVVVVLVGGIRAIYDSRLLVRATRTRKWC
jgi:hypothetical protein